MARAGRHRGAKSVDLVIAAAAETVGLTGLHYYDDYDRDAWVTGQATEWIDRPVPSIDRPSRARRALLHEPGGDSRLRRT